MFSLFLSLTLYVGGLKISGLEVLWQGMFLFQKLACILLWNGMSSLAIQLLSPTLKRGFLTNLCDSCAANARKSGTCFRVKFWSEFDKSVHSLVFCIKKKRF